MKFSRFLAPVILSLLSATYIAHAQIVNPSQPATGVPLPGTGISVAGQTVSVNYGVANSPFTGTLSAAGVTSSKSITASANTGAFSFGTLGYSDVDLFGAFGITDNNHANFALQNLSNGASAKTMFSVANDSGTASTFRGEFGINSSTSSGANFLTLPNASFVRSSSGDLSIGTVTSNAIHFGVNSSATDAMTISSAGVVSGAGLDTYIANHAVVQTVANVAALRALSCVSGLLYSAQGYYTQGDGGGGAMYVCVGSDTTTPDNGSTILATANTQRLHMALNGALNIMRAGAKCDLVTLGVASSTDDTTAIQNALNAYPNVAVPQNVGCKFSSITINYRGSKLQGGGNRSILYSTATTNASITLNDTSTTVYPGGQNAYVNDGQFTLSDFTLYTGGSIGINLCCTRSTGTAIERVYMKPNTYYAALTNSTYASGTTAIGVNNTPWSGTYSTYQIKIAHDMIAGYQTAVNLDNTVNFVLIDEIYAIDNLNFTTLAASTTGTPGVTGVKLTNAYIESGIAAARGIVFGAGGGNNITVTATDFELTNVAATQYAYDFSAGGTWTQILASNIKYLIQGDGNAVNNRRIIGTAPAEFVEFNRDYTSATYGTIPMMWTPGVTTAKPFNFPQVARFGGFNQGLGTIVLGRNDTDAADSTIAEDASGNVNNNVYNNWTLNNQTGATNYMTFNASNISLDVNGVVRPSVDNLKTLGDSTHRWTTVYATTGTINTSDAREKKNIKPINDKVLDAWENVHFVQFEWKADIAGVQFGVIAQNIVESFEREGLRATDYGIVVYDKVSDRYGVRYDQVMAVESAYERREIERLRRQLH